MFLRWRPNSCVSRFGMLAIRERPVRMGWLLASAAMGLFAFSVREFAVAAPASVLLAAICAQPRRLGVWASRRSCRCQLRRRSTCGTDPCRATAARWARLRIGPNVALALSSVAFVVAPAALIGAIRWRRHLHRFDVVVGVALGLADWSWHDCSSGSREGSMPDRVPRQPGVAMGGAGARLSGRWPPAPLRRSDVDCRSMWWRWSRTSSSLAIGAAILGAHLRRTRGSPRLVRWPGSASRPASSCSSASP